MGQTQSTGTQIPPSTAPPSATGAASCPLDHNSREAWAQLAQKQNASQSQTAPIPIPPDHPPVNLAPASAEVSACPVDHKAREAWLKAAQAQQGSSPVGQPQEGSAPQPQSFRPKLTNSRLSTDREVSTIPRALPSFPPRQEPAITASTPSAPSAPPVAPIIESSAHGAPAPSPNAQTTTSDIHTSASGHWVYPSEAMFFNAMSRKQYSPREKDMRSVVPLHNAVNERTWLEILAWEHGQGSASCGGPKLVSFAGDASKLTPRARWKSLMGYQKPFDRHDWVVDRCGTKVEYVIDFYEGKRGGNVAPAGPVSFYLDVRPKLNSLEGCRMRFAKYWGLA